MRPFTVAFIAFVCYAWAAEPGTPSDAGADVDAGFDLFSFVTVSKSGILQKFHD
jgi:hypothetical protein